MENKPKLLENLAVCSWSLRPKDTADLVSMVRSLGLSRVQLALNAHRGSAGGAAIGAELAAAGIEIVSGMFGTVGEDYSTLESIQRTGGVVPDGHWEANLAIAREVVEASRSLGIDLVSFHAGFLPEDASDPDYAKLIGRLRTLATMFADAGIDLAFETGQEEAGILASFLADLAAPNVGVNFDPANMILYAKGDPVSGLKTLLPYLKQIHIKDAILTTEPGTWGSEVVVGTGQVDWTAFLAVLEEAQYSGALAIECEAGDNRLADILAAKNYLESILTKETQS
jgi:sugar phosphate isomerase/epimerase